MNVCLQRFMMHMHAGQYRGSCKVEPGDRDAGLPVQPAARATTYNSGSCHCRCGPGMDILCLLLEAWSATCMTAWREYSWQNCRKNRRTAAPGPCLQEHRPGILFTRSEHALQM